MGLVQKLSSSFNIKTAPNSNSVHHWMLCPTFYALKTMYTMSKKDQCRYTGENPAFKTMMKLTLGVNFINILHTAFKRTERKRDSQVSIVNCQSFYAFGNYAHKSCT